MTQKNHERLRRLTHSTAEQALAACVELRSQLVPSGPAELLDRLDEALRQLRLLRSESGWDPVGPEP